MLSTYYIDSPFEIHIYVHTPETAYVSTEVASSKSRIVKTPMDAYRRMCMYVTYDMHT